MTVTFWSQLLGLLLGLPLVFAIGDTMSGSAMLHGAVAGLGSGVSLLLLYSSTRYLFVGVSSAVSAVVACIIPVLYAAVHHSVSKHEAVGVVICVVALLSVARWRADSRVPGSGSVVWPSTIDVPANGGPRQELLGIGAALASGLGLGAYYIALAGTSPDVQVGEALESRLVSVIVLGVLALASRPSALVPSMRAVRAALPVGAFGMAGAIAYATAVRAGNLGVVVPIVSMSPAVAITGGWLALHERVSRRQLTGVALAMAGVVIVTA
jgi:drug/metabolite transporter (DMT)-like permease